MGGIYLPVSVINDVKNNPDFTNKEQDVKDFFNKLDGGSEIPFSQIKGWSIDYRTKTNNISYYLDNSIYKTDDLIDLTDECIALAIDGPSIRKILENTEFKNLIAIFGLSEGHVTFSLVGADPGNPNMISPKYQNAQLKGLETWPRLGVLGFKKDSDDVLNSKNQ